MNSFSRHLHSHIIATLLIENQEAVTIPASVILTNGWELGTIKLTTCGDAIELVFLCGFLVLLWDAFWGGVCPPRRIKLQIKLNCQLLWLV